MKTINKLLAKIDMAEIAKPRCASLLLIFTALSLPAQAGEYNASGSVVNNYDCSATFTDTRTFAIPTVTTKDLQDANPGASSYYAHNVSLSLDVSQDGLIWGYCDYEVKVTESESFIGYITTDSESSITAASQAAHPVSINVNFNKSYVDSILPDAGRDYSLKITVTGKNKTVFTTPST